MQRNQTSLCTRYAHFFFHYYLHAKTCKYFGALLSFTLIVTRHVNISINALHYKLERMCSIIHQNLLEKFFFFFLCVLYINYVYIFLLLHRDSASFADDDIDVDGSCWRIEVPRKSQSSYSFRLYDGSGGDGGGQIFVVCQPNDHHRQCQLNFLLLGAVHMQQCLDSFQFYYFVIIVYNISKLVCLRVLGFILNSNQIFDFLNHNWKKKLFDRLLSQSKEERNFEEAPSEILTKIPLGFLPEFFFFLHTLLHLY